MKRFVFPLFAPVALCAMLLTAPAAQAQLTLTLTPPNQVGAAGSAFTFSGTLANPTASSVFLNGDSLTFNGPGTTDDSAFFNNAPFSLDPLGSGTDSYTGSLFTVTLDPAAAPGSYFGTFAVLGGADGSAMDTVATQDFSVTIPGDAPPPVPEASTAVSLSLLILLGGAGVWKARRLQGRRGA